VVREETKLAAFGMGLWTGLIFLIWYEQICNLNEHRDKWWVVIVGSMVYIMLWVFIYKKYKR
jgi:uncharacterized integral membrane protein